MGLVDFFKKSESDLKFTIPLTIFALIPRLVYFFVKLNSPEGLPVAYDTKWYLEHANVLSISVETIFYLSYQTLLAFLLFIFKSQTTIVFVQMVINAISVILVYKISIILFYRRVAILAGLIYAFTFQSIYWSIFILTESFFVSLLLLTVYFLMMSYESRKKVYQYLFLACAFLMIFFRPNGIITMTFMFVYMVINLDFKEVVPFWKKRRLILSGGIVIAISGVVILVASGILNPLFHYLRVNLEMLLYSSYASGQIFDLETPYDYKYNAIKTVNYFDNVIISFFINNWKDILILYVKRAISFWGVWMWKLDFSNIESLLKCAVFLITTMIGALGIINIITHRIFKKASILILMILSFNFFCILFFIDTVYRYRLPALIFVGMINAYGIDKAMCFGERLFKKARGTL